MKIRQNIIIFILLIKLILVINSTTFDHINTWTPELLYEYSKWNSLNLNHMIIDPENYLDYSDLSLVERKMSLLLSKFNIRTFIILISHFERNGNNDINSEIQKFVSYFNYMIKKEYPHFNDSMSLTTVFVLKERKMRMRTGSIIRKTITDGDAKDILDARKYDLRRENYFNVINGLVDDIYNTYEKNIIYHNTIWYKHCYKIILTIILLIIGSFYLYHYLTFVPENEREKKIKDFLRNNRDRPVHHIFNESCIICLDKFEEKNNSNVTKEIPTNEEEKTSVLDCGHKFHEKCIVEWLKKHNKCPICRIDVKFDNNNNCNFTNYQSSTVLDRNNYEFVIDIQSDFYPDEINETQRSRISSIFSSSNEQDYNDSNYNNDSSNFNDFDSGSGGATSDW